MSLGRTIAQLRKEKGWTQAEFGSKLDVHQSHVTRWESDRVRPRDSSLEKIAEVLEVSLEDLNRDGPEVLASSLNIDDPELVEMLVDIPKLHTEELQALKTVLRNFLSQLRIREALAR